MADNVTVDGIPIAADDIGGVRHQRIKIEYGADNTATEVSPATPLPVSPDDAGDVATALTDGRKTSSTPGIAVALVASATPCKWVAMTALPTNTDLVWVGGATVLGTVGSEKGTPLEATESATIPIDDAAKVFLDPIVSGEGVTFTFGA